MLFPVLVKERIERTRVGNWRRVTFPNEFLMKLTRVPCFISIGCVEMIFPAFAPHSVNVGQNSQVSSRCRNIAGKSQRNVLCHVPSSPTELYSSADVKCWVVSSRAIFSHNSPRINDSPYLEFVAQKRKWIYQEIKLIFVFVVVENSNRRILLLVPIGMLKVSPLCLKHATYRLQKDTSGPQCPRANLQFWIIQKDRGRVGRQPPAFDAVALMEAKHRGRGESTWQWRLSFCVGPRWFNNVLVQWNIVIEWRWRRSLTIEIEHMGLASNFDMLLHRQNFTREGNEKLWCLAKTNSWFVVGLVDRSLAQKKDFSGVV